MSTINEIKVTQKKQLHEIKKYAGFNFNLHIKNKKEILPKRENQLASSKQIDYSNRTETK